MNETPRTGAAWEGYNKDGPEDSARTRYKTSRTLELELAEARALSATEITELGNLAAMKATNQGEI